MKALSVFLFGLFAMLFSMFVRAAGPDLSSLSGAVDMSTVGPAILLIAAAVFGPRIILKAITFAKAALSRA